MQYTLLHDDTAECLPVKRVECFRVKNWCPSMFIERWNMGQDVCCWTLKWGEENEVEKHQEVAPGDRSCRAQDFMPWMVRSGARCRGVRAKETTWAEGWKWKTEMASVSSLNFQLKWVYGNSLLPYHSPAVCSSPAHVPDMAYRCLCIGPMCLRVIVSVHPRMKNIYFTVWPSRWFWKQSDSKDNFY